MFLVTIYANALVAWRQYIKEAAQVRVTANFEVKDKKGSAVGGG